MGILSSLSGGLCSRSASQFFDINYDNVENVATPIFNSSIHLHCKSIVQHFGNCYETSEVYYYFRFSHC